MKLQILFVTALALIIFYDGYLKGPIATVYEYGKILSGAAVIAYLIYSYVQKPADFYTALDFVQSYLQHSDGGTLKNINRILEGKPKQDRNVTQLMKKKVAANQQWKCGHCSTVLDASYEVDHILALYKGGSNEERNLVALCRNCHGKKTVEERLT
jgi:hypothetical protein